MADKRRRKSLSMFRHRHDSRLPSPLLTGSTEKDLEDDRTPSPAGADQISPRFRPRALQKSQRASTFGSLRSLQSLDADEKAFLTRSDSKGSSLQDESEPSLRAGLFGNMVILYGEVQSGASTMFRKKTHFLVLTESHLVRFKSHSKAREAFPDIPAPIQRSGNIRGASTSSNGTYNELQTTASTEITSGILLDQVVAVYKLDDGRPYFTIEISHLDERARKASAMQLLLNEPREAESWLSSIRSAAAAARQKLERTFLSTTVEHLARTLDHERDYDPEHFRIFKVVQRASSKIAGRSSVEDLTKLSSTTCYLAIGLYKVHIIPLQRPPTKSSSSSLNDLDSTRTFGITTLSSVSMKSSDDAFQLGFKHPLRDTYAVHLASCQSSEIVLWLRFASEYLRPQWLRQPFIFDVPRELEDFMDPPNFPEEDYMCFDRTLIAYCSAYGADTSRICYSIDEQCEDAPCFRLAETKDGTPYTALELLAVFRALRYNESFSSVSFAGIDLSPLKNIYDYTGSDIDCLQLRSGSPVNLAGHQELCVLALETRGLALKSKRLRRLDFSHTLPPIGRRPEESETCGVLEALVPLCKRSFTNVDWIVLTGLQLSDTDLNFLVDAASQRQSHLRAIEIGDCGLSAQEVDVLLSTAAVQGNTMEVIDISGVQGRFSPELFQRQIGAFSYIRRLDLTRVQKTAGLEPLIAPETLLAWRLESLRLSQTTLNEQTVESIAAYLASPKSDTMRELQVNQCGLTGTDLATFFHCMSRAPGKAREMHVGASENRLKEGIGKLIDAVEMGCGPASLSMRMVDFEKELHFRSLVQALTVNTTMRNLDLSKASLPYDASTETCEALREMFAHNMTLEELDISGEHAYLDVTRFGIGLNIALRGLEQNRTLRTLRIEHQGLGLQGASTLAVVMEANTSLVEIHCEHNEINLQSLTVLVNALEKNEYVLSFPTFNEERTKSIEKFRKETEAREMEDQSHSPRIGTIKRSFTGAFTGKSRKHGHRHSSSTISTGSSFSEHDVALALGHIEERWDKQVRRIKKYLWRNYCLATGQPWEEAGEYDDIVVESAVTEKSLSKLLEHVQLDQTPTVDRTASVVDYMDEKLGERQPLVFQMPED